MSGRALGWFIFLLWISPFLILFFYAGSWSLPAADTLLPVLGFTILQAALSAVCSVIFGFTGALGLLSLRSLRTLQVGRVVALLPNVVPTLMVILAAMNVWRGGRGLGGIIFVHTLLNAGLVATVVASLLSTRVGRMAELAWVEGVTRKRFLMKVLIPLLWSDLLRISLFVFALCMTSFAVPLLLGGSKGTTIEVLIFENVRQSLNWSVALGLSALQTLIVLGLSFALRREENTRLQNFIPPVPLLEWRGGLFFTFLPSVVVIGGMLLRLPQAFSEWQSLSGFVIEWEWLCAGSVLVGLLTGIFTMCLLIALLIAQPSGWLEKLMLGFVAPSTALVGFALLLLWRWGGVYSLIKISIGLTLIFAPAFYRLYWHGLLQSLRGQVESAQVLGASPWKTATEVLLPQAIETCMFLAGIAAFWAWGDFALSAVVGENAMTLAMLTHGLASSYRLASATLVAWMLIAIVGNFPLGNL